MSGATAGMALSAAEVAKHASKDDCWVIIHGKVRAQRAATECSVMTKELSEPCVQAYDVTGADSPNVSGFLGRALMMIFLHCPEFMPEHPGGLAVRI